MSTWITENISAPPGAKCSKCNGDVTGTNYIWRGHRTPTSFTVELAHPKCAAPYPFCHTPAHCANAGRCTREIVCNN